MSNGPDMPCAEWVEKLASLHFDDLPPSEKAALEMHLSVCPACKTIHAEYKQDRERISHLSADDVPVDLPRKLLLVQEVQQLFRDEERKEESSSALSNGVSQLSEGDSMSPLPNQEQKTPHSFPKRGAARFIPSRRMITLAAGILIIALLIGMATRSIPSFVPSQQQAGGAFLIANAPVFSQSTVYINNGDIYAFRSDNGSLLRVYHRVNSNSRFLSTTPTVVDGVMYVVETSCRSAQTALARPFQGSLCAIRTSDGALLWQYPVADGSFYAPVVVNGIVYVSGGQGPSFLYALRASDGRLLWRYETSSTEELNAPVVTQQAVYVGSNQVYVGSNLQKVYALNRLNGALLWKHVFPGTDLNTVVPLQNTLYVSVYNTLYALRLANGAPLWQKQLSGNIAVVIADGSHLYIETVTSIIYALRSNNGDILWQQQPGITVASLLVMNTIVYLSVRKPSTSTNSASSIGGYVVALRASDGTFLWQYKVSEDAQPELATGNGAIYVTTDKFLAALRASDGRLLWRINVEQAQSSR